MLCVQKLDLPRICILQMRKQKSIEPRVQHRRLMQTEDTPVHQFLVPAAFYCVALAPAAAPTLRFIFHASESYSSLANPVVTSSNLLGPVRFCE